eukprot:6057403-Alexandrium_andersonii.AAC.1
MAYDWPAPACGPHIELNVTGGGGGSFLPLALAAAFGSVLATGGATGSRAAAGTAAGAATA